MHSERAIGRQLDISSLSPLLNIRMEWLCFQDSESRSPLKSTFKRSEYEMLEPPGAEPQLCGSFNADRISSGEIGARIFTERGERAIVSKSGFSSTSLFAYRSRRVKTIVEDDLNGFFLVSSKELA